MKLRATVPEQWGRSHRQIQPGDVVLGEEDGGEFKHVQVLRAGHLVGFESVAVLREAREVLREHGRPDETDPASYVDVAMRGRLDDLALLVGTAEGKGEGWADPEKLEALGVQDKHADPEVGTAEEEAQERLDEFPLAVEATTTFEVVLGTGGPDDRLLFECSGGPSRADAFDNPEANRDPYEIDRVLYRYSWSGSAELELTGEDKETAEALARRVVPELVE